MKDPQAALTAPIAIFKKRGAKGKAFRKREATPPPADSDDDSGSDYSEDDSGRKFKRRKTAAGGVLKATSKEHQGNVEKPASATVFAADRNVALNSSNDATKQVEWFDEGKSGDLSVKSLLGTTRAMPKDGVAAAPDGAYKGLANQTTFIQKNPNAPTRTVGPIKGATTIRTITITDFAPDVCKDYRLTGFCGFGDNCKYLHAREDYKAGWQLDKEWENVTKGKSMGGTVVASADRSKAQNEEDDAEEALLENIPFVCLICKEDYKNPAVTRCGHYFCEACALKRYRKDPSCAQCGQATSGIFNSGKRLQKLLDRKRERAARLRREAIERGEEVSDEEEAAEE